MNPILFEDRPELEAKGVRFRAYFASSTNGIEGLGNSESEAEDDLHAMVTEHQEWLVERAMERGISLEPYDAPAPWR